MEINMEIPQKTKNGITICFSDTTPNTYLKEYKSEYNRDTCTLIFIEPLFTIAKLWEQLYMHVYMYTHTHIYIYIFKMEFYSDIRRMKLCGFKVNGWNWRTSWLSEISQVQKDKSFMFFLICGT
jgi:hypothetical protein